MLDDGRAAKGCQRESEGGELDRFRRILKCAALGNCEHCVACSEEALQVFLSKARESRAD